MSHLATLAFLRAYPVCTLAAALLLSALPSARADDTPSAWLAAELSWAEHSASPAAVSGLSSAVLPAASTVALEPANEMATDAQVARDRGRYRTMRLTGYTLAALTLAVSLASIPMWKARSEHNDYYGDSSCGPNAYPVIATAAFASGLTVGIVGSLRDRTLDRAHRSERAIDNGWRSTLAGLGVLGALTALVGSITVASLCSS